MFLQFSSIHIFQIVGIFLQLVQSTYKLSPFSIVGIWSNSHNNSLFSNRIIFLKFDSIIGSIHIFQIVGIFLPFNSIYIFQIVGMFIQFGQIHIKVSLFSNRLYFPTMWLNPHLSNYRNFPTIQFNTHLSNWRNFPTIWSNQSFHSFQIVGILLHLGSIHIFQIV